MLLQRASEYVFSSRRWLRFLALLNLGGFLFGLWYYRFQLAETPPVFWILTIDSPLFVLLFALACLTLLRGRRLPGWFGAVTAIGLVKAGLWTDLVLWLYWPQFQAIDPVVSAINFPLHAGMALEGLLLLPQVRVRGRLLLPVLAWFLGGDLLDYLAGTVTRIPPGYEWLLFPESVAASAALCVAVFWLRRPPDRNRGAGGSGQAGRAARNMARLLGNRVRAGAVPGGARSGK